MSTPVNLPALGESVTEGTVTRWLKQVGDSVEVDEPLLEVSTDKVDTEIPSPVAGTLLEIKAEEDETVEIGAELCIIGEEGEGGGSADSAESEPGGSDYRATPTPASPTTPGPTLRGLRGLRGRCRGSEDSTDDSTEEAAPEEKPAAKSGGGGGAAVRRSPCPPWASPSPKAPSPAG